MILINADPVEYDITDEIEHMRALAASQAACAQAEAQVLTALAGSPWAKLEREAQSGVHMREFKIGSELAPGGGGVWPWEVRAWDRGRVP